MVPGSKLGYLAAAIRRVEISLHFLQVQPLVIVIALDISCSGSVKGFVSQFFFFFAWLQVKRLCVKGAVEFETFLEKQPIV